MAWVRRYFSINWEQRPSSPYPIGIPLLTRRCHDHDLMAFWNTWGCHRSSSPSRLLLFLVHLVGFPRGIYDGIPQVFFYPLHISLCDHNHDLVVINVVRTWISIFQSYRCRWQFRAGRDSSAIELRLNCMTYLAINSHNRVFYKIWIMSPSIICVIGSRCLTSPCV